MATIVKYEWDLGNGEVSASPTPSTVYFPGVYTIKLITTTSDNNVYTAFETNLVYVAEDQQNLLSEKYFTDPKSLHYGINRGISSGWSRNAGDNFVWPESQAAVSHAVVNGVDCLLVWDMYDGYQYCINPRNTTFSQVTHLDKGEHEIACSATFGSTVAENNSYEIMHQETTLHLRKDIDTGTKPTGMSTHMSLIGEDGEVIEKVKLVTGNQIVFKEQSEYTQGEHKSIQIKFETDKSGYQMTSFESIYKSNDKSGIAGNGLGGDTAELLANVMSWVTAQGEYTVNLATGVATSINANYLAGPDGNAASAVNLVDALDIANIGGEGTLLYWYSGNKPDIGVATTEIITKGGYTLEAFPGTLPANITFDAGSTLFDIRIVSGLLSADTIYDYGEHFLLHLGV